MVPEWSQYMNIRWILVYLGCHIGKAKWHCAHMTPKRDIVPIWHCAQQSFSPTFTGPSDILPIWQHIVHVYINWFTYIVPIFTCDIVPNCTNLWHIANFSSNHDIVPKLLKFVTLCPNVQICDIVPNSSKMWHCAHLLQNVTLCPKLQKCDIVPNSSKMWHCAQLFQNVTLCLTLQKRDIVPNSSKTWHCA